jgi:hypothetical protein
VADQRLRGGWLTTSVACSSDSRSPITLPLLQSRGQKVRTRLSRCSGQSILCKCPWSKGDRPAFLPLDKLQTAQRPANGAPKRLDQRRTSKNSSQRRVFFWCLCWGLCGLLATIVTRKKVRANDTCTSRSRIEALAVYSSTFPATRILAKGLTRRLLCFGETLCLDSENSD